MVINNKGFSMVELIVSIAIFGLVSIGIVGFMMTGTNLFSSINTYVDLQYETQTAMVQIQEYVIDCNYAVKWDEANNTLTITNEEEGMDALNNSITVYKTHIFVFNEEDNTLYYGTDPASVNAIMARYVEDFNIILPMASDIIVIDDEDTNQDGIINEEDHYNAIDSIDFELTLKHRGRQYFAEQSLFLRNTPRLA